MKDINIKEYLKEYLNKSKEFKENLDELWNQIINKEKKDEMVLLKKTLYFLKEFPANPLLLDLIADFLLMMDDDKIIDTYEFSDIQEILEIKVILQKMNLSFHEDILYFFWNVLNEKERSLKEVDFIINECKKKIIELEELKKEIDNY